MRLNFVGIDPNTDRDHCPTVWVEEDAKELVIQGWKADRHLIAACLETGGIPDGEQWCGFPREWSRP